MSIHLSSELSGTWDAARWAAEQVNGRYAAEKVRVVDSRVTAMALGFGVLAAARRAARGASLDEVYEAAVDACNRSVNVFYVDTLEFLRRGGRIGAAAAILGTALSVKPLLHLKDGRIVPLEKVRTATRALARLETLAIEAAARFDGDVTVAVHHLAAAERAEQIKDRLEAAIPNLDSAVISEVGAVIGAHVGPGMIAVVVSPAI